MNPLPVDVGDDVLSPVAAAIAAAVQFVLSQRRFDLVGLHRFGGGRAHDVRRHLERVRAVAGGDGQQRVLVAEIAELHRGSRPPVRALIEAVDVDHPEASALLVVQLIDGVLDLNALAR